MRRRDFLRPRQLAHAAGQILGAVDVLPQEAPCLRGGLQPDETSLIRLSRRAMATQFEIVLPFGTPYALQAGEAALDGIDRLEDQLTVYRETSEVSSLNRRAGTEAVTIEERLFDLLALAERLARETQGAFDITAGPLIKTWGIFRRKQRIPGADELRLALERVGMRHLELDAERRSVRFRRPGVEINLGSIGKGHALDRTAELLRSRWKISAGLLHGGHSSVYAIGNVPGSPRGWPVSIRHPWDPERRLATVWLRDRALGTSAATFQHLEYEGRKLGHILDPRTGWPAEGLASASVLAPTAAEADALATAFFILGPDAANEYCRLHPEIGAVLLPVGAEAAPILLGLANALIQGATHHG